MITIGIDDTDIKDTRGTNAVAREILTRLGFDTKGTKLLRHQLLDDPRVPYTSKNGSASIVLEHATGADIPDLVRGFRKWLREWFIEGSDPGLCVTESVPDDVAAFGHKAQRELIDQREARELAAKHGIHLEGLGGTEQGVIGALAAVGLVSTGDDGRVVHLGGWPWPDDLRATAVDAKAVYERGIDEIRVEATGETVRTGKVDLVKNLRPNLRKGRLVLFVEHAPAGSKATWRALRPT
jgi:hypothetical protein